MSLGIAIRSSLTRLVTTSRGLTLGVARSAVRHSFIEISRQMQTQRAQVASLHAIRSYLGAFISILGGYHLCGAGQRLSGEIEPVDIRLRDVFYFAVAATTLFG